MNVNENSRVLKFTEFVFYCYTDLFKSCRNNCYSMSNKSCRLPEGVLARETRKVDVVVDQHNVTNLIEISIIVCAFAREGQTDCTPVHIYPIILNYKRRSMLPKISFIEGLGVCKVTTISVR